jgi:hypothetical protein
MKVNNMDKIPQLLWTPAKQEPWYDQIKDDIQNSKRPTDKMSVKQIKEMYIERKFLCDTCGKEFDKTDFTLEEHILHLIDPIYYWSCEDCFQSDLRNNRIIAMSEEKIQNWQCEGK